MSIGWWVLIALAVLGAFVRRETQAAPDVTHEAADRARASDLGHDLLGDQPHVVEV